MYRITPHDRKMYEFIKRINFTTVRQLTEVFYKDKQTGNIMARRRLQAMKQNRLLREVKCKNHQQYAYVADDKYKTIFYHQILVRDYYAKLLGLGVDVTEFKAEKPWCNGDIRSDAFIIYNHLGRTYIQLVEAETSFNDYKHNIEKYLTDEFFNEFTENYGRVMFQIVLIDNTKHNLSRYGNLNIVQLDYEFNNISDIFTRV